LRSILPADEQFDETALKRRGNGSGGLLRHRLSLRLRGRGGWPPARARGGLPVRLFPLPAAHDGLIPPGPPYCRRAILIAAQVFRLRQGPRAAASSARAGSGARVALLLRLLLLPASCLLTATRGWLLARRIVADCPPHSCLWGLFRGCFWHGLLWRGVGFGEGGAVITSRPLRFI
jgi:hypothetical protein